MKRNMKIAALALALAACLLLTGCYTAPDEVNNGGDTGRTANSLPFPTLQATATVTMTPDTVTVESPAPNQGQQNIFPNTGTQAAPTATPESSSGNNAWNNWASGTENPTPAAPTAVPTGGTIVFETEQPGAVPTAGIATTAAPSSGIIAVQTTPAVATPTPQPKTMRLGFQGESVRTVQRKLKELGYYNGSIDGDFGEATDKALKAFQKANGLTPDGKVGDQTLKKLNDKNAKTYRQANATATPKTTATPRATATPNLAKDYYLRLGVSGAKVQTLQRRLIELGWLSGKVTGTFDEATEAAVRAFQDRTSGIYTDGVAGPATLRALYSSGAARTKKAVASNSVETLEFGSEGADVTKLQQKLKTLGYLAGYVDGKFGVETQAAVIAFQKNNNLTADGKAGTATQNKLYSNSANKATGNAVKINGNNTGGRDTKGIASTGYETLARDSEGYEVRRLQDRLRALGYAPGYSDGKYGATTEAAVMAFQSNNNLTVDGKAGPATQRKLYGTSAQSPVTYATLRQGDNSEAVRNMQYTLYELGYYDGAVDGVYGQTTADAVRAFQISNAVQPVDGVAGNVTLSKMYSSSAVAATTPYEQYTTVRPGDVGDSVAQVQDCLVEFGYLELENVNGVYDDLTTQAVKNFQAAWNLTVDGVAGAETQKILFGF